MTAHDEADTHARRSRKHMFRAAMLERQADRLLKEAAGEWARGLELRDLETAAREAAGEARARAALTAAEEDSHDGR